MTLGSKATRLTASLLVAAGLAGVTLSASVPRANPRQDAKPAVLAVIVNPRNPTTNLTFNELRSYLKLEQTFWPNKTSCELFLRPSSSVEMGVLLDEVYRMTAKELRKYWVGKVFRGEIAARPAVVPTASAAGNRVSKVAGAVTVVLANEVPEGVRVVTIDGKKPGDAGYPLKGREVDGKSGP